MRWLLIVVVVSGCDRMLGLEPTTLERGNPRTLVFQNSEASIDLVDLPVLVSLDASRIDYAQVVDPTTDLRFHDATSDTDLPFDVDTWNATGESYVWVRVPRIGAASTDEYMQMYYGASAHGAASPRDVWQGYDFVLHGNPGDFTDSAGGAISGMPVNIAALPGPIGGALGFSGPGSSVITLDHSEPLFDGWNQFTIELWVYADVADASQLATELHFFDKGGSINLGRMFAIPGLTRFLALQFDLHFVVADVYDPQLVPVQRWFQFVYSYDGQQLWLYRNGNYVDILEQAPQPLAASNALVTLGATNDPLQGGLDEVRFTHVYRDPDWIFAQYLAATNQFIRFVAPGEKI